MAPPHSRAPVAPQLLEIPLQLGVVAFSVTLLGLSAWDFARWKTLRDRTTINNLVRLEDNGMQMVVTATMIVAAITFAVGNLAAFLGCTQFPKRRGERTGKGTYGYILVGLVELTLSGALTGIASAYTAYAVQKHPSFSRGPNYSEPFTDSQKVFLRSLYSQFANGQLSNTPTTTTQSLAALGPWANINNLDQANAFLAQNRYLNYTTYRVTTAIAWITLGTTFFVTVVHFALPIVLKFFGMTRPPKGEEPARYRRHPAPAAYGSRRHDDYDNEKY